ncbi:MAG: thymidylate kinase [bacterium]
MSKKSKGKLIVFEGVDGSGKATQADLLIKRLKKLGHKTALADFPQYGQTFFGDMAGLYLKGAYGEATKVNPYLASLLYALDRWQARPKIEKWLKQGRIVISNRYTSSSAFHQTTKMSKSNDKKTYLRWLTELEYKELGIPKPDLTIFLNMPFEVSQKLVRKKGQRNYIGTGIDQHERSPKHQKQAWLNAQQLIKQLKWKSIPCSTRGVLDTPEVIAERVWKVINLK